MLGMLKAQSGTVRLFGKPLAQFVSWGDVGYVPQRFNIDTHFPATVRELFESLPHIHDHDELFKALGIPELFEKRFIDLSGGQQQRVMTALALVKHPKLLVLDEPSVGVDAKTNEEFFEFLGNINKEKNITIIVISHDIGLISKYAKTVVCLNKDICCEGPIGNLDTYLVKVYGKKMQVIHHHHGDESCSNT